MKVTADGFTFNFTDALDAFVFDEMDKQKPTYHGLPMKAVDVVAEFADSYVYVEVKDFSNPKKFGQWDSGLMVSEAKQERFNNLRESLMYKYRDSYLFRHAEGKVEKPVHYICLMGLDDAQSAFMQDELSRHLPVGQASPRWKQAIVESCHVVNMAKWNKDFPKWPVSRVPEST